MGPGSVIGTDIFTPLADRDGDGDVDPADFEIVIPVGSNVVAGDISVASIFGSTSRGVVVFQVLRGGLQGQFFDVRYATSTRELTRATKSYTETLSIPSGGVVDGWTFTLTLNIDNLPLQDANGDALLSSADITVTVPGRGAADTPRITGLGGTAILANQANGLASGDTITLVHTGSALSAGTQINVAYLGLEDLLTVKGAPADTVPLRLRETGADTGVYQATIIATNGSFGEPNSPNGHLNPTLDPTNIATADANGVALGNTKPESTDSYRWTA